MRSSRRWWSDEASRASGTHRIKNVVPIRYRSAQLLKVLSVSGLFANGAGRSLLTRDVHRSEILEPDLGSESAGG
jgi:hypothetical protein